MDIRHGDDWIPFFASQELSILQLQKPNLWDGAEDFPGALAEWGWVLEMLILQHGKNRLFPKMPGIQKKQFPLPETNIAPER